VCMCVLVWRSEERESRPANAEERLQVPRKDRMACLKKASAIVRIQQGVNPRKDLPPACGSTAVRQGSGVRWHIALEGGWEEGQDKGRRQGQAVAVRVCRNRGPRAKS